MNAFIITIGDEILLGQILDTNAQYIARQLTAIGVEVVEKRTIGDRREVIRATVDEAMRVADLVLVTGGLGPTKDDVTKKVLADYFDTRLVFNTEAMGWLEELLHHRNLPMNEGNRSQACLPERCRILRNFKGTASGMWFTRGGKSLISMPGVPFEMEHLMEEYVLPELREAYPDLLLEYRVLKVYDVPESQLALHLKAWEDALPAGFGLAYLPSPGMVRLRVTARGEAVHGLDALCGSLKAALQGMRYTEGDDTIEKQLGATLRRRGKTVATAESCTGGEIARLLTSVPGCSAYFRGGVVAYSNGVKTALLGVPAGDIAREGVVSGEVARGMALGARRALGADYAVATTGVAGPDGGTEANPVGTVWIAVATPTEYFAQRFAFSFTRERNIAKAAAKALEMVLEAVENDNDK